ncbi:MAG: flavodoxin [Pseudoramibacter sp.]
MAKYAVVYWSGTGNTEMMAKAVAEGIQGAGQEAALIEAADFSKDQAADYEGIAFGCPSMGTEQLEETEFEPMFDDVKGSLGSKPVVLFGSYGWGDGEWMRTWESDCEDAGINCAAEPVICNETPDDEGLESCKALGAVLTEAK